MTAEGYREQAAKLRRQAGRAKDGSVREQLLLMSRDWDKLADEAEELEKRRRAGAN
ncbi:hypothetical protein [Phenylobacterium sp.]|uniref:hypothetical protein n=1 Tax=Phenylobacterium sp. TaxID=1871053 RepID=UPI002DEBD9B8|nr:hypothetical protein [Phenylobacterium sp.]